MSACRPSPDDSSRKETSQDSSAAQTIDDSLQSFLEKHGIVREHLALAAYSPDSAYLAVVVDSAVRFGPGDPMWSEELPSGSYAVRNRIILYLYEPSADSISRWAECEEVVNLYDEETSRPLQPERLEEIRTLRWSPEGRVLLVLKDRRFDGLRQQEILLFEPEETQPRFLDMFKVWRRLMNTHQGARGTAVKEVNWVDSSKIKVILSVLFDDQSVAYELLFDAGTGRVISTQKLPSI